MKRLIGLFLICTLLGCSRSDLWNDSFLDSKMQTTQLGELKGNSGLAMVFLSPVCPLCQNYSVTLRKLAAEFESEGLNFVGIVSGNYYSNSEVEKFISEYDLDFTILMDPEFTLSSRFDAAITPEVILFDSLGQEKYQGGIDNWAISLGQKRQTITAHYLEAAIHSYLNGKEIEIKETKAVGCYIE